MRRWLRLSWLGGFLQWFLLLCTSSGVHAEVRLPSLISDHMVLQQGLRVPICGHANPKEQITVSFRDQKISTTTRSDGRWCIYLDPLRAGGPDELTVSGQNTIVLRDVLVGEVWVCAGQSNMEWWVARSANAEQEIAEANYPRIRLFTLKQTVSEDPLDDVIGTWKPTSRETVGNFSAVGYFFGRALHRSLDVPIGLVNSSWGSPGEAWVSRATLEADLSLQPILWKWKRMLSDFPQANRSDERQLQEWEEFAALAKGQGKQVPGRPLSPLAGYRGIPGGLFNGMIAPLTSYAIRGAIWYQGESNAMVFRSYEYRRLFQALINDWRAAWGQGPFPFLFVQLASFGIMEPQPSESAWAELREAQLMALSLPNTGMAVTIDIGEAEDIHPKNKQDVGARLALTARAVAYGQDVIYSGPVYRGTIAEANKLRIKFDHVGSGLMSRGGPELRGFAIAGDDRQFVWAEARIEGNTIVVSSPHVRNPVAVRYAWADNPGGNLYNKEGLPASPFRTDDWPNALMSK